MDIVRATAIRWTWMRVSYIREREFRGNHNDELNRPRCVCRPILSEIERGEDRKGRENEQRNFARFVEGRQAGIISRVPPTFYPFLRPDAKILTGSITVQEFTTVQRPNSFKSSSNFIIRVPRKIFRIKKLRNLSLLQNFHSLQTSKRFEKS